jgi:sphinganine-1-phosphate aldolase
MSLPPTGRAAAEVLAELEGMRAGDVDWRRGRAFSLAYFAGDEVLELAQRAYARFSSENALNTEAFPSLKRIQAEVVATIAGLVHGGGSAAGFMTSGGTESLLLAVLAAREHGRKERGIERPEMVLPASAHAAFEKGAHYFGVRSVRVPVRADFRADVDATAKAITPNTVLVVGSAPQYPQGVIDPIAELAELASAAGALCHVDACMGGMVLPFLERLGEPIPRWDFRAPGVTSMSIDLHKYGYTAKGASVLVHRTKELRRHQTFVTQNWLGGAYGSSGVLGTKSGGALAAAWAVLNHLGEQGYLELTRRSRATARRLIAALRATPGLRVLGEPDATLVAFAGEDGVDVLALGQALRARGWVLDAQGPPPSLHATVNAVHEGALDAFLADLAACVELARGRAEAGRAASYATVD